MIRILFLCVTLLIAGYAEAGPWPRGKGKAFLSFAYEETILRDDLVAVTGESPAPSTGGPLESSVYTSAYGEYGLTDRITLGFDTGQEDRADSRQTIFFVSLGLSPSDWRHKIAAEFGIGEREYPADGFESANLADLEGAGTEQVLRPGLLWGYGFETPLGPAWISVEARMELRQYHDEQIPKIDTTFGIARGDRSLIYLQAQYSDYPLADPKLRLVPTYVLRLRPWLALETAVLADVWGDDRVGLRAAIWFEF